MTKTFLNKIVKNSAYTPIVIFLFSIFILVQCKSKDDDNVEPVFEITNSYTELNDLNCCEVSGFSVLSSEFAHKIEFSGPASLRIDSVGFAFSFSGGGSGEGTFKSYEVDFTPVGTGSIGSGSSPGEITMLGYWIFENTSSFDLTLRVYSSEGMRESSHTISKPQGAN